MPPVTLTLGSLVNLRNGQTSALTDRAGRESLALSGRVLPENAIGGSCGSLSRDAGLVAFMIFEI